MRQRGKTIMHIRIEPCLLGYAVSTWLTEENMPGHGFIRNQGIYESFGKLCLDLIFTEQDYVVELR